MPCHSLLHFLFLLLCYIASFHTMRTMRRTITPTIRKTFVERKKNKSNQIISYPDTLPLFWNEKLAPKSRFFALGPELLQDLFSWMRTIGQGVFDVDDVH